jgi:hypothetical protein
VAVNRACEIIVDEHPAEQKMVIATGLRGHHHGAMT